MEKEKTIYELDLHEELHKDRFTITRVSGGWLYESLVGLVAFVPFSTEFQSPIDRVTKK